MRTELPSCPRTYSWPDALEGSGREGLPGGPRPWQRNDLGVDTEFCGGNYSFIWTPEEHFNQHKSENSSIERWL